MNAESGTPGREALPANVGEAVRRAGALLQAQQVQAAESILREWLTRVPDHADLLRLLAVALRLQGRDREALPLLRQAAAARPDDALIQNTLGTALDGCGDAEAAHAALRRACELAPQVSQLWANLGKFLGDHARFAEAVPVLERTLAISFHDASQLRLAHALRVLGRTDESARRYRQLLETNPADGFAWIGLAGLRTRSFSCDDLQRMQVALQTPALNKDDRISIHFALAKALDDQKRYTEAFAQYQLGNCMVRDMRPWNAAQFSSLTATVLDAFEHAQAQAADESLGNGVIFIVGMPRSGSSLVEQVLASHPQLAGGGELDSLHAVIEAESTRVGQDFPTWVGSADSADWQRLGEQYLDHARRLHRVSGSFTDKMPGNWLRVGAALAMLPAARVIECRRDPLETCLSCFRTLFMEGAQACTYNLDDLAHYWHDCARASQHWQSLHPSRVRVQSYEALVAEPDTEIRALLEFCRLPFDAACERFYETPRAVATASASQVREPLMRGTARAHLYADALDPLRAALIPRHMEPMSQ